MILRSVMKHVRDQNWVAVGLDFLIVVVGVFIGIQVANWNDLRRERSEESRILERLQIEVDVLIDVQRGERDAMQERARVLEPIQPVLFGKETIRALSVDECRAVMLSHVYPRPSSQLPVLAEMQETGRFDLLRDSTLKRSLRDYILLQERTEGYFDEITNEPFRLHSRHPDMVVVELAPLERESEGIWTALSGEGYGWSPVCRVQAMRDSPGFLNDYMDNMVRIYVYLRMYEQRIQALESIQELLQTRVSPSASRREQE